MIVAVVFVYKYCAKYKVFESKLQLTQTTEGERYGF